MHSAGALATAAVLLLVLTVLPPLVSRATGSEPASDVALALGQQAFDAGDYPSALVQFSLALHRARGEGPGPEAEARLRLGLVQRRVGRLAEAASSFDRAADLWRALGDAPGEASALQDRGLVERDLGRSGVAVETLGQAGSAWERARVPRGVADAVVAQAAALLDLGRARAALRPLEQAETIYRASGDGSGLADTLTNRAAAWRMLGRLDAADAALAEAVTLFHAAGDDRGARVAWQGRASVALDRGDLASARAIYDDVLKGLDTTDQWEERGAAHLGLGSVSWQAGDAASAVAHWEDAASALERAGDVSGLLRARLALAAWHTRGGRASVAVPVAERAVEEARSARDGAGEAQARLVLALALRAAGGTAATRSGAEVARAAALAGKWELAPILWRALTLQAEGLLSRDPASREAADLLSRAISVIEAGRWGDDLPSARDPLPGPWQHPYRLLAGWYLARGDARSALLVGERARGAELATPRDPDASGADVDTLDARRQRLEDALHQALAGGDAAGEQAESLGRELARVRVEFAAAMDRLRAETAGAAAPWRVDPEDLEAAQAGLPRDAAVLEPLLLEDRLVLLLFRSDWMGSVEVAVPRERLEQDVAVAVRLLRSPRPADPARVQQAMGAVYDSLVRPIADRLAGVRVLLVCPSGILRLVPFPALWTGERWLGETLAVANLVQVSSLVAPRSAARRLGAGARIVAVANPDGSLLAAEGEAADLQALFPGGTRLAGAQATRGAVLAAARGSDALHLATHGVLDATNPATSYIALHGEGPEGRIGYSEIPGLAADLRSLRLAVLSACETAVPLAGTDAGGRAVELGGLANQFRRAGVPSLLASLWRVSDESTRLLMRGFYEELRAGAGRAVALQRAQSRVRAVARFQHPYYWAPFVLTGEWD